MSEENNKEHLSAKISPNSVDKGKKRARTINNWPLFIALIVIGVVICAFFGVVASRSGDASTEETEERAAPATELARHVIGSVQGGVVEAPKIVTPERQDFQAPSTPLPLPPPLPNPVFPMSQPLLPNAKGEIKPIVRENENIRKIRELRYRQWEAALNGPIKVQHEEIKLEPRSKSAELSEVERQLAHLSSRSNLSYEERVAAAQTIGGGNGGSSSANSSESAESKWRNAGVVEAPSTMHIIRTGAVIPAILISGINSDLKGQIIGQVSQDVYDTPTHRNVLIPQGSKLVGEYLSQIQYGQSRVFVAWQRIVFPDGKALDIGEMPGSSGAGYAGFRDRVNNHYARIFGSAVMMSGILAGVEMTQNNSSDSGDKQRMSDALSESLGQVLGGVIGEMLSKNMSIAPTIEIRPGYRLNVMVTKDLVFPGPYKGFDYRSP